MEYKKGSVKTGMGKRILILFCITIILLSGCVVSEPKETITPIIDANVSPEVKCNLHESQEDWHCTEPCSCLFVDKMLVCNGIAKTVYSDLNREGWARCNQAMTEAIIKINKGV